MSGDEVRKEIAKRKGALPSPGTVYPVLKHLAEGGLIEELHDNGKEKKYRLTKAGQRELKIATEKFVTLFCDMKKDFEHIKEV